MRVKGPGKLLFLLILCISTGQIVATPSTPQDRASPLEISETLSSSIAEVVEDAIRAGKIPGAVVLIGNREKVLYRHAFGNRAIEPSKRTMTTDTIFDIGSLTKVVATATALMQLVEKGKIRIEDPVAKYWPDFKRNGKEKITLRQLLTHYSGLRASLDIRPPWSGYRMALEKIVAEKPVEPPGVRFLYSDINFIILGEVVSRISGQPLDAYCSQHIFKPLNMKDTGFTPSPALRDRIAPTQYQNGSTGKMLWGEVHDPTSYCMGGVAGHAGLFSTADDLSTFAQALLNGGRSKGGSILSPLAVEKMTSPQSPPNKMVLRGFGWDIDSPFSANRGELFPIGSYGHTGYPGTSIWIDPFSEVYVIILTNRVHPYGKGDAVTLRSQIATLVASSLGPVSAQRLPSSHGFPKGYQEATGSYRLTTFRNGGVQTGIDVLSSERFASLAGLRVGLITNHSGIDSAGRRTIDLFHKAPKLKLACIFCPEHGLSGTEDKKIATRNESSTGLTVHSLYGDTRYPTERMLNHLDALVFDLQDAGVRFYTYMTTMAYAMEAAAKRKIAFYVLDRPNPITASSVQGPVMDGNLKSFTGYFPLPVRHGMTLGELAGMFDVENGIGVKLHVIKMHGYSRTHWYDETGLQWVNPSPNLRTLTQATLYPGVAMVEGANVSVGRGTNVPFEVIGAPWINGRELASYLNSRRIQGVRFMPADFTPNAGLFEKRVCRGIQIVLVDRQALDSPALGVEIASALYRYYPGEFQVDRTLSMLGSYQVLQAIKSGQDPNSIIEGWQEPLQQFLTMRAKYLLY